MEILPKIGIGNVRFGMKPPEVLDAFPEWQKYENWMGSGDLHYSFKFHGIIFGFDDSDGSAPAPESRLAEITISSRKDLVLWGQPINNWTKVELGIYLDEHKIYYQEANKQEWSFPFLWMILSFDENEHIEHLEMWINEETNDRPRKSKQSLA